MNQLESFVYKKVKNNYIIKNAIRNIYQGFYDLMPNYDSKFCTQPIVLKNCFFGFHDLNPFSQDNKRILSNKLTIPLRMPTSNDILEVGFWNGTNFGKWNKIGETKAWNYHKGCRLQWVDDTHCAYNIAEGNTLKSRITNIDTKESTTINWPIDTVSPNGLYATSFSYERLQQMMPGYGYVYKDEYSFLDEQKPSGTGLFLIDLKNNTRKMLLDLAAIASINHEEDMDDAFHFVTHTEFSQDNRYIAFLHRWYKGVRRKTRLMVIDTNTNEIHVSPTTGMVSHYCWNSKNGIVAYCRVENIDSHVYFFDPTMRKYNLQRQATDCRQLPAPARHDAGSTTMTGISQVMPISRIVLTLEGQTAKSTLWQEECTATNSAPASITNTFSACLTTTAHKCADATGTHSTK